jgi:hypothetical protein
MGMEYGHSSSHYSEQTAAQIDDEIRALIKTAHTRAVELLTANRSILDNMSRVLVEKETIYTEEVSMLMKGADYKEVIAYMDAQDDSRRANPFVVMTKKQEKTEPVAEQPTNETNETQENNDGND